MNMRLDPAVWFPTVRTGTGTDVFTERLVEALGRRNIRTEITWLPLRSEYAPWTVAVPEPPAWATVAHVNTWLHPRFLPKRLPIVATIHHAMHDPVVTAYKGAARATYHRFWIAPNERRVLRRVDRVVAVSQFVAETARKTLLDVPMQVIYNGVDTNKFRPSDRQRKPHKPFRLLYVGSWKALKGAGLLASIMRELGSSFELRYTGGPSAARDKVNMPANMRDIGRLKGEDAVVAAMQSADALLFPSRSEGHPLVVIEAMSCGLPIIAARVPSLLEIVQGGVGGVLCSCDDVLAFAKAVRRTALDARIYEELRSQARSIASARFPVDETITNYVERYAACIRERRVEEDLLETTSKH